MQFSLVSTFEYQAKQINLNSSHQRQNIIAHRLGLFRTCYASKVLILTMYSLCLFLNFVLISIFNTNFYSYSKLLSSCLTNYCQIIELIRLCYDVSLSIELDIYSFPRKLYHSYINMRTNRPNSNFAMWRQQLDNRFHKSHRNMYSKFSTFVDFGSYCTPKSQTNDDSYYSIIVENFKSSLEFV